MNQYDLDINFNRVTGKITIDAESEGDAIDKALDYVDKQLANALPELDIEIEAEVSECYYGGDPDMAYEEEIDRYM